MNESQFQDLRSRVIGMLERDLDPRLTYHNPGHTKDVLSQVERIARGERISDPKDMLLLRISALFHDTGFIQTYADHEQASSEIMSRFMQDYDVTDKEIEKMKHMISATRIPQTPKNKLEEIICDADLDYLGRDDFEPISRSLMEEFLSYGVIRSESEWDQLQLRFFENHRYFTETCRSDRNAKKQIHLQMLHNKHKSC